MFKIWGQYNPDRQMYAKLLTLSFAIRKQMGHFLSTGVVHRPRSSVIGRGVTANAIKDNNKKNCDGLAKARGSGDSLGSSISYIRHESVLKLSHVFPKLSLQVVRALASFLERDSAPQKWRTLNWGKPRHTKISCPQKSMSILTTIQEQCKSPKI